MTPRSEQVRLAITVFDEFERLWNAMLDLLEAGLSNEHICLLALEATAEALRRSSPAMRRPEDQQWLARLLDRMEPWTVGRNGGRIVGTDGGLMRLVKRQQPNGSGNEKLPLIIGGQKVDLETIVGQGAVALLVQSSNPSQQSRVTRILLSHSTHWITTHEFPAQLEIGGMYRPG